MKRLIMIMIIGNINLFAFTANCYIEEWGVGDPIKLNITIKTGGGKLISIINGKRYSSSFLKKDNYGFHYSTSYGVITLGKIHNGKFSYEETVAGDGFSGTCKVK